MISYDTGSPTIYDIKKQKDELQTFMAPTKSVKKVRARSRPGQELKVPLRLPDFQITGT
jgi:hypothetical protein